MGAGVVNALSKELIATVKRDGAQWEMSSTMARRFQGCKSGRRARHRDHRVLSLGLDDLLEDGIRP